MRVIELLNKIANGEEVPNKIKYKNKIYEWKEYDVCYGKIMTKKGWVKEPGYVAEENRTYFYLKHCFQDLNDEVEIIEENPTFNDIREKYGLPRIKDNKMPKRLDIQLSENQVEMILEDKINEILDYLEEIE